MHVDVLCDPVDVPMVETEYRTIKTAIPAPGTAAVMDQLRKYESRSMQGQLPIVWDRAEDFSIYDKGGNRYIDFTSTIFVTNVGHANPRVAAALRDALDRPLVHAYVYAHERRAAYLKRLIEFADGQFEKAFLLSAGTEATEACLKLIRMYGQKKGRRRLGLVCIEGNWHGRTMGAQMMSSNAAQKEWIGYEDPNIHHLAFPYPWSLAGKSGAEFLTAEIAALEGRGVDIARDVCGFLLETFQGWGAVFYPNDFVQGIAEICTEHGILLAFDEMQSGFGRTGRRFGYEHYGVRPDLICCGKGMGSGVPLSGVIGSREVMDLPETGDMSSTHSANPMVCAAGLATLDELEERDLVGEAARKGEIFHDGLNAIRRRYPDKISHVQGKGLVAALIFRDPSGAPGSQLATDVAVRCMQKGVLVVHTGRESIKLAPPLTIPDAALREGLHVIDESLCESLGGGA